MNDTNERSVASAGSVAWPSVGVISENRLRELMANVGLLYSKSLLAALRQCDMEARLDVAARLRLTDEEREAVETCIADDEAVTHHSRAATLRGLLDRLGPVTTPAPPSTPAECSVPPEWLSRPYYVDPPSGHRYGFPRLYDPQADGNMTEWLISHGYPERLARQGVVCTFTAAQETVEE